MPDRHGENTRFRSATNIDHSRTREPASGIPRSPGRPQGRQDAMPRNRAAGSPPTWARERVEDVQQRQEKAGVPAWAKAVLQKGPTPDWARRDAQQQRQREVPDTVRQRTALMDQRARPVTPRDRPPLDPRAGGPVMPRPHGDPYMGQPRPQLRDELRDEQYGIPREPGYPGMPIEDLVDRRTQPGEPGDPRPGLRDEIQYGIPQEPGYQRMPLEELRDRLGPREYMPGGTDLRRGAQIPLQEQVEEHRYVQPGEPAPGGPYLPGTGAPYGHVQPGEPAPGGPHLPVHDPDRAAGVLRAERSPQTQDAAELRRRLAMLRGLRR